MQRISRRTVAQGAMASVVAVALGPARAAQPAADESKAPSLFDAFTLKEQQLPNRMVMAPLTRGRAGASRTANTMMAEYYVQRASAGLIVSEGTAISPQGYGWVGSPGIYTPAQVAGWKGVTQALHAAGGRIFLQLWHVGRVSHPDFQEGEIPVGPSAIAAAGDSYTPTGKKQYVTPRAMTKQEIQRTVADYAKATQHAREAGFDGVEIHAANGYLIDQFIRDGSNQRSDEYGGSTQRRLRFLLEVTEAVAGAWSADRVGVRLSPHNPYNDMKDSAPHATFEQAAKALNRFDLAYLHVAEDIRSPPQVRVAPRMRRAFTGTFIANTNYDAESGAAALKAGDADLIAYGKHFLANPDLVERFRQRSALNAPDIRTFYTDGAKGYVDYPSFKS